MGGAASLSSHLSCLVLLAPVVQNMYNFIQWISHIQHSQYIPFDAVGEIAAQANDSF